MSKMKEIELNLEINCVGETQKLLTNEQKATINSIVETIREFNKETDFTLSKELNTPNHTLVSWFDSDCLMYEITKSGIVAKQEKMSEDDAWQIFKYITTWKKELTYSKL